MRLYCPFCEAKPERGWVLLATCISYTGLPGMPRDAGNLCYSNHRMFPRQTCPEGWRCLVP